MLTHTAQLNRLPVSVHFPICLTAFSFFRSAGTHRRQVQEILNDVFCIFEKGSVTSKRTHREVRAIVDRFENLDRATPSENRLENM